MHDVLGRRSYASQFTCTATRDSLDNYKSMYLQHFERNGYAENVCFTHFIVTSVLFESRGKFVAHKSPNC